MVLTRRKLLYFGAAVLAMGVAYMALSLPWQPPPQTGEMLPGDLLLLQMDAPYSLGTTATATVDWKTTSPATVTAESCGVDSTCRSEVRVVKVETGTSGRIVFSEQKGEYYGLYASWPTTYTYTVSDILIPYFYLDLPGVVLGLILIGFSLTRSPEFLDAREATQGGRSGSEGTEGGELLELLGKLAKGSMVVIYSCPHCHEPVKISGNERRVVLLRCPKCGEDFREGDLVVFLSNSLK